MSLLNLYYSTFLHALNHNHLFQSTVFYPQDDPEQRWHISTVARQQGVVLWQTGLSWRWSRLTQMWWYNTQMGSPHNDLVLFFIPLISVFVIATPTGTWCENWVAQQHTCWSLQSSYLILICFELCFFWRNINKKKYCLKNVVLCGMDKYSIHISQMSASFQSHGFICQFSMDHYFLACFLLRRKVCWLENAVLSLPLMAIISHA